jgi:hypothetical protein
MRGLSPPDVPVESVEGRIATSGKPTRSANAENH